jgi:hypothetical protein
MEVLKVTSQAASGKHGGKSGDFLDASAQAEAWKAFSDEIEKTKYLTPEQKQQLTLLANSILNAGAAAKELSQTQLLGMRLTEQAATQLASTMIDAAFGAKVNWEEAIKSIIEGLVKAAVTASIVKAIEVGFGLSGGGVVGLSGGGVASQSESLGKGGAFYGSGGVTYAAAGIFKPRGTDTVPAMLTPGEIVLTRSQSHDALTGKIVIAAARLAQGVPSTSILGGRLAMVPAAAHYADGGIVSAASIPMGASDAGIRPVATPRQAIDASMARAQAGRASSHAPMIIPINIGGARLTTLLIENYKSIREVNDYIEARNR